MTALENGNIKELSDKIDVLQDEIREELKDIRVALLGNEFNANTGLVGKVAEHEKRIKTLEEVATSNKIIVGILTVIGIAIVGGVVTFIFSILK